MGATPIAERRRALVSDAIAASVEGSVAKAMIATGAHPALIEIPEWELSIDNAAHKDEVGVAIDMWGVELFGFRTEITPDGLLLTANDSVLFSMSVKLSHGSIGITVNKQAKSGFDLYLTEEVLERGIEAGMEAGLTSAGVRPAELTLSDGQMTIRIEPIDQSERRDG
jgi:hypothetical protein